MKFNPDQDCIFCNGKGSTGFKDVAVFNPRTMDFEHKTIEEECHCVMNKRSEHGARMIDEYLDMMNERRKFFK